ncbi:MAG: hypothetical protein C0501_10855 [Isosphaera sp.]|nr:hypothetical protein [Isosphaera sp.]
MRRPVLLALGTLAVSAGCRALDRDVVAIEHAPGGAPGSAVAGCAAAYQLVGDGGAYPVAIDVPEGAAVGFRRDPDGLVVAFAGEHTTSLPEGRYAWKYTPTPANGSERFAVGTRDWCEKAAKATAGAVLCVTVLPVILCFENRYGASP